MKEHSDSNELKRTENMVVEPCFYSAHKQEVSLWDAVSVVFDAFLSRSVDL